MTANAAALSKISPNAKPLAHSFRAQTLTLSYRRRFYNLIQEQAEQHSAAADQAKAKQNRRALCHAIVSRKECRAFLIVNNLTDQCLTAVTYYPTHGNTGKGLYLEDIVTTKHQRNQGAGSFALATLAQIAVHSNFRYVAWECAAQNKAAQSFYTHHGADFHDDRLTWRAYDTRPKETDDRHIIYEKLATKHFLSLCYFFGKKGVPKMKERMEWLMKKMKNPDPFFVVAREKGADGKIVGFASAYRNFSTFRIVNGLHIHALHVKDNDHSVASGLLTKLALRQRDKGWTGHTDFTVHNTQEKALRPTLEKHGFEPLSYGEDRMIVRSLSRAKLDALARRSLTLS